MGICFTVFVQILDSCGIMRHHVIHTQYELHK